MLLLTDKGMRLYTQDVADGNYEPTWWKSALGIITTYSNTQGKQSYQLIHSHTRRLNEFWLKLNNSYIPPLTHNATNNFSKQEKIGKLVLGEKIVYSVISADIFASPLSHLLTVGIQSMQVFKDQWEMLTLFNSNVMVRWETRHCC